jgi:hypothetical protein
MRTALLLISTLTRRVAINELLSMRMNLRCCKYPKSCYLLASFKLLLLALAGEKTQLTQGLLYRLA